MTLTAYPVAKDAHEALVLLRSGKAARATREKEAEQAAGGHVVFVSEHLGPLYDVRDDALSAYAGLIEDDRPGRLFAPEAENQVCSLTCRIKTPASGKKAKPLQPVFKDGHRWPAAPKPPVSVWQLSISYWKLMPVKTPKAASLVSQEQARHLRRKAQGEALTPQELLDLAQSPLTAIRPQKALDFGLFDFIPPDDPGIIIADE